ncbi:MAG: NADP(H)-dependent aldo-keto reductase [Gammaproteobacteria bacterium]|jgi:aryl-alcohol dehydrogenase-like predicted oxidoreductase|nr:NADP(H)-dependent aldo-keto reductase [Gammaproteobacteria bacterium]|tara:strand:- start:341 stop:1366 length:1026 start_codon:yes stop_codon:yes gene_type:complete
MKYRKLGNTDLDVSVICLGTMSFGEQNSEKDAHEQLSFAADHGVNFLDTAEMYAIPPKEETQGLTEKYIGTWIEKNSRDKYIIATKVAGPGMDYVRNGSRLSKKHISQAIDQSLKRLKTDYIDLYQVHWPERKSNYFGRLGYSQSDDFGVSIDETLTALDDAVKSGKVRYVGISNETPWGVMEYLKLYREKELVKVQSIQNPYSLLNRIYEVGLAEISYREKVGLLAYSPLGFGMLTGKYQDKPPKGSRLELFGDWFTRYSNEKCIEATNKYIKLAKKYEMSVTHMSLAFVNTRPFVTSNIIGATTINQLEENINSIDIELPETLIEEIEKVHEEIPNPAP